MVLDQLAHNKNLKLRIAFNKLKIVMFSKTGEYYDINSTNLSFLKEHHYETIRTDFEKFANEDFERFANEDN